jgi:hypothetical protein
MDNVQKVNKCISLLTEELSASEDRPPSTELVIFLISGLVISVYLLPYLSILSVKRVGGQLYGRKVVCVGDSHRVVTCRPTAK